MCLVAQKYQCDIGPGDILFVPAKCPHHVVNLETSIAISANFIDASNVADAIAELSTMALTDVRAEELRSYLVAWTLTAPAAPVAAACLPEPGLTWKQYKQHRGAGIDVILPSDEPAAPDMRTTSTPQLYTVFRAGGARSSHATASDETEAAPKIHRELF